MMKRILFILIAAFAIWANTEAQELQVSGTVKASETGELLPGVNVVIKGTTNGVVTNIDGKYSIKASSNDILQFSFIGFSTQEIPVNGKSVINVALTVSSTELDELVVVGYGTMKKSDLTGSVATVKSDAMRQTTNTSVTESLQGRVSGVNVMSNEGSPGAGLTIEIRGASSINAGTQPLYVIDGIPVEVQDLGINTGIEGPQSSPLANIDPNNIESVEILKDASAAAIYGSRGANGVVIITTKGGVKGKSKINLDVSYGLQTVTKTLDLLNSTEYAQYFYESGDTLYNNPETFVDSTNTDWQKEMYGVGKIASYNLNASGGNDDMTYFVGGGYFSHDGLIDNNKFERYSFDLKMDQKVGTRAKLNFKVSLGHTLTDGVATGGGNTPKASGIIRQILRSPPTRPLDFRDDQYEDDEAGNPYRDLSNPKNFNENATNLNNTTRILAQVGLNYEIAKGLNWQTRLSTNHNNIKYEAFYPSTVGRGKNVNGEAIIGHNQIRNWALESFVTYNKKFENQNLMVMAGATAEEQFMGRFEARNLNFAYSALGTSNIGVGTEPQIPSSNKEKSQLASYLGRINYSLLERYLFTASLRADGSSRFGADNKWGYFPSGSFAWRASEEGFIKSIESISNLKFRTSVGFTGNQRIANYLSLGSLDIANYGFNDVVNPGLANLRVPNPDLRWEKTKMYDSGIDLGLFDNRVIVTADAYLKITDDMLLNVPVPVTSGYFNYMKNMGSMENKGLEFSLNTLNIKKKDFTWETSFNISFNRNKVTKLGEDDAPIIVTSPNGTISGNARVIVGEPVGVWWGYVTDGIYASQEEVDALPTSLTSGIGYRKYKDLSGPDGVPDGVVNDFDRTIVGRYQAKNFGGLMNSIKYKNIMLDCFLQWRYGGTIYNANRRDLEEMGSTKLNKFKTVLNHWAPPVYDEGGNVVDPGNPNSLVQGINTPLPTFSDYDIEDGSYLRIKSVSLNYIFSKKVLNKIGLDALKIFVKGENLYTFTNYSGYDPEVNMNIGTNGLAPGIDWGAYPRSRTFTFGFNLGF